MEGGASRDQFVRDALSVLETAESALESGEALSDLTILIGAGGGIHVLMDNHLPLDSLEALHGSRRAYRVRQHGRKVSVEGRAGNRTCSFGAAKPDGAARLLLANLPAYAITTTADSAVPRVNRLLTQTVQ